jgi:hypothetical protein
LGGKNNPLAAASRSGMFFETTDSKIEKVSRVALI